MYVGDKGILLAGFNGQNPRVYPESKKYEPPPRSTGRQARDAAPRDVAIDQWIAACKGGPAPVANFESQSPVTEAFLLGCLAQRLPGERFEWSSETMRVTNSEAANRYVDPPYRREYAPA
jgi:hypothetical protein